MEVPAYATEAVFVKKRIAQLEAKQKHGMLSTEDEIALKVLKNIRAEEEGALANSGVLH